MTPKQLSTEEVDALAEHLTPEKVEALTKHFSKFNAIKELKPITEALSLLIENTANLIFTLRQKESAIRILSKEKEVDCGLADLAFEQEKKLRESCEKALANSQTEVHSLRPKADAYEGVCRTLGVEGDILGYISRLTDELEAFCRFAEKESYLDSDWYAEKPELIDRYKAHVAWLKGTQT